MDAPRDEALHDVCREYGVRLAREALEEAHLLAAWELALEFAREIGEKGGDGAEFLRRISFLLYSYASIVVAVRRAWGRREVASWPALVQSESSSGLARQEGEASPAAGATQAKPKEHTQLSLWDSIPGGGE